MAVVDEPERLEVVRRYDILDTPPDGAFDRITAVAARLLGVPIAIVSVVDEDRIWFKSHHGLDANEIPRDPGLCASAIMQYGPYVLPDARLDPVALTNPLVAGDFGLRFYAAVPLTVESGHNLGTLCVIDRQPRELTADELQLLQDLAALVVNELELRLAARIAVGHQTALRRQSDQLSEALRVALLPPRLPPVAGLELAARYEPDTTGLGGDFYDVFPLRERGWGIAVGDVCGKGAAAATITAAARHGLRAAAIDRDTPAEVLALLNETLMIDADSATDVRFCTLVYAELAPGDHGFCVSLACGGHPLPFVVRADGTVEQAGTPGTLIGCFEAVSFTECAANLRPGDALVLYTDGVTEAVVDGKLLGQHGLEQVLAGCRDLSAEGIVDCIAEAVLRGDRQRDDVAILVARVSTV